MCIYTTGRLEAECNGSVQRVGATSALYAASTARPLLVIGPGHRRRHRVLLAHELSVPRVGATGRCNGQVQRGGAFGRCSGSVQRTRVILMLATEDEREAAKTLATMAEGAQDHIVASGKLHGTAMFGKVPGIEKVIATFLREGVGEPTKTTVYGSINSNIWHPRESGWIERINPSNMRHYSSAEEAEARGLRKTRSMGPGDRGKLDDPPDEKP